MPTKQKKILIAEDEKPMARALKLKLTHEGFDTTAVFDGQSALDLLKKEKFDLVILDLVMPRVDGFQVLEKMKSEKINVPTIVTSNLSQIEDEERVRSLGAKDFFVKSHISIADVVTHVKAII
ncbi:MAG: DNA-binding response OmpR family regulator [Acidimicrobiales bacterium]|jgi:DNA-binding response OmpR family regulator